MIENSNPGLNKSLETTITKPSNVRFRIVIMTFLSIVIAYMDRANLSVASVTIMQEYGWDTAQWGVILASFFFGYVFLQVPAGWLADKIGGRRILAAGVGWWSFFTMATCWATGFKSMLFVRSMLGIGEAVTFPAETAIASKWVPIQERARAQAWNLSGMALSLASSVPIVAWIIAEFGWRMSFYAFGALGFVWTAIWLWYSTDDPADHHGVNKQELQYILQEQHKESLSESAHWRVVLSKGPIWALAVNYFFQNYMWYLYMTWLPGYLVMARGFSIMKMGIYGMLPFFGAFLATNMAGYVSDKLTHAVGVTKARKYIMYAAFGGSAIFLYLGSQAATGEMAVLWITLSTSCLSMNFSSFWALPIDLGPKSAGLISGLMNSFGTLAGIAAPIATGWIVAATNSWNYALGVAVGLAVVGILVCALFISGEQVVD